MFDNKLDFFENKHRQKEYEKKLKKLKAKFHLVPSKSYDLETPCPLELKPTKLTEISPETSRVVIPSRKHKHHDKHKNKQKEKPTPSNDDSILDGLQTVIDLCSLLGNYDDENKPHKTSKKRSKTKSQNEKLFHFSPQVMMAGTSSRPNSHENVSHHTSSRASCVESSPTVTTVKIVEPEVIVVESKVINKHKNGSPRLSQTQHIAHPEVIIVEPEVVDKGRQSQHETCNLTDKPPSQTCIEHVHDDTCEVPCKEPVAVVAHRPSQPALRRRSPADDIKQYWAKRNLKNRMSLAQHPVEPEVVILTPSKEVVAARTASSLSKSRCKSSSVYSISGERPPSKEGSSLGLVEPSTPSACDISELPSDDRCCNEGRVTSKCKSLSGLSCKCFPPLEIVPTSNEECFSNGNVPGRPLTCRSARQSLGSRQSGLSRSSCDPMMLCSNRSRSLKQITMPKSRHGIPFTQPILGCCSAGKCSGDVVENIRYAAVRISDFKHFSTYEIMRPRKQKPKNMPTYISELFVTSRQQRTVSTSRSSKTIRSRNCSLENEMKSIYTDEVCSNQIRVPPKKSAYKTCHGQSQVIHSEQPSELPCDQGLLEEPRIQSSVGFREPNKEVAKIYSGEYVVLEPYHKGPTSMQKRNMSRQIVVLQPSQIKQSEQVVVLEASQVEQPSIQKAQMSGKYQVRQL